VNAFRRVLISGVGLIGGSWALGLRRAGYGGAILGFDRLETLERIRELGVVDEVSAGPPEAAGAGDLVVLATPVAATVEALTGWARALPAGTVVTDVGSTKRAVCEAARGLAASYVGGHPMAGAERSGVERARADLFDGATWFLVAPEGEARDRVASVVSSLGATPVTIDAEEHDRRVALGSHLPQIVASALAAVLVNETDPAAGGPGLASMTRLAASPWSVWGDILKTNRDALTGPLAALIAELEGARDALEAGDSVALEDLFRRAGRFGGR
jgi:prephenate dehydrogenase